MVSNRSQGPVQIVSLDLASLNFALRELSERSDTAKGLRGRSMVFDRVRIEPPEETKDAVSIEAFADSESIIWDTTTPHVVRATTTITLLGAAPNAAEYLVGSLHTGLTAERLATSSSTVSVDVATPGSASWAVIPGGVDHNALDNLTTGDPHTQYPLASTDTFTLTATGMAGTVTGTARYVLHGTLVCLWIPALSGTSNATSFTCTGLPAAITPTRDAFFPVRAADNGTDLLGMAQLTASSDAIGLFINAALGTWTNSGTKTLYATVLTYPLV